MPPTGLLFYRTPKDLHQLIKERPRSLQEVHNAVSSAVTRVERRLLDLEVSFHGGKDRDADISDVSVYVKQMLVQYQLCYVHSSQHVKNMLKYCRSKDHPFHEQSAIESLEDYDKKICEYLPEKFTPLLEELKIAIDCLEKYNQSFYSGEFGGMLHAPFTYETQRTQFKKICRECTSKIYDIGEKYVKLKLIQGVNFDIHIQVMARRLDLGEMLLFQLVPEAIQNIRLICEQIKDWIRVDKRYAADIHNDMQYFNGRIRSEKSKVSFYMKKASTLASKIKLSHRNLGLLQREVTKLNRREKTVDQEIGVVQKRLRAIEADISLNRRERDKIIEQSDVDPTIDVTSDRSLMSIKAAIGQLTLDLNPLEDELDGIMEKKDYIRKKQDGAVSQSDEIRRMNEKLMIYKKKLSSCQSEVRRLESCHEKLREIYVFRTSLDMVKCLYMGTPLKLKLLRTKSALMTCQDKPNRKKKVDTLKLAIEKSSRGLHSDADWQSIYASMPFVPPRGQSVLDRDVEDIFREHPLDSATPHTRAEQAFNIWSSVHAEASLELFEKVLCDNNRKDLVLEIRDTIHAAQYDVHPMASKDNAQKNIPQLDQADLNWRGMRDTENAAIRYMKTFGPERYSPLPELQHVK